MPEMDGLAAAAAIREQERDAERHVPIIAMTANALDSARQQCLAAGMDGYVSKPVAGNALLRVIDEVTAPRGRPPPVDACRAAREGSPSSPPDAARWDPGGALGYVDGDPDALLRLAAAFLTALPTAMTEIRLAFERRDAQGLRGLGHKLKGSLGLIGAKPGRRLAEQVETAGKNGDWCQAAGAVAALETELTALEARLSEFVKEKQTCEF